MSFSRGVRTNVMFSLGGLVDGKWREVVLSRRSSVLQNWPVCAQQVSQGHPKASGHGHNETVLHTEPTQRHSARCWGVFGQRHAMTGVGDKVPAGKKRISPEPPAISWEIWLCRSVSWEMLSALSVVLHTCTTPSWLTAHQPVLAGKSYFAETNAMSAFGQTSLISQVLESSSPTSQIQAELRLNMCSDECSSTSAPWFPLKRGSRLFAKQ